MDDWDEEIYLNLQSAVKKEFDLQTAFSLYEDIDGDHVYIEDKDDLEDAFQDEVDSTSGPKRSINLFLSVM